MLAMRVVGDNLVTFTGRWTLAFVSKRRICMQSAIMNIWQGRFLDEGKDLVEGLRDVRLFLVMQVQVQVLQVGVRVGEVVFASVCDVENVSDAQRLDYVRITGMVPVPQVEPAREDLVWVVLCLDGFRDERLSVRADAKVFVVCGYLVEAANAEVKLSKAFIFECLEEQACIAQRYIVLFLFICLQTRQYLGLLFFVGVPSHF